jgi:hypothetical protein
MPVVSVGNLIVDMRLIYEVVHMCQTLNATRVPAVGGDATRVRPFYRAGVVAVIATIFDEARQNRSPSRPRS